METAFPGPCNQITTSEPSLVLLEIERKTDGLKSSQLRGKARHINECNPYNKCKNRHVIGVRRTTNTRVGKNINVSGHMQPPRRRISSQAVLPLTSQRKSRGSIGGKYKPSFPAYALLPTFLSQILETNKIEGFISIIRLPHPQNTCWHLKQHLTLHCLVLFQHQWGSPSRLQMTASPFLDSTCVYCKKKI